MVHEAGLLYPEPSATLNPLLEVNLTYPFHHADDRNFEFLTRLACPRPRFNLHPAADRYGASVQVCMSTPMRSCSSQRESPSSAESTRQRVENGNGIGPSGCACGGLALKQASARGFNFHQTLLFKPDEAVLRVETVRHFALFCLALS